MSAIDAPIAEEVRHEGGRRRLVAEDQSWKFLKDLFNIFKKLALVDRLFKEIGFKRQSGHTITQFNSFAIVFSTDGYSLALFKK